ncbi:ABC transporter ATP-binding protein [Spiroplasma sp. NBRC 100390]|uniref:ABC transporter ATP-binding protein n=1 Tax=unclassified Spiroplasma TaxID=2637901 RepID=UPI0008928F5F|nr:MULTISPECIES: ABC transporter ATP-binding protein [unclassified Spiroplasma]AOX44139.1 ABC transporter ATP-binding protein [Spiroplasma sp. TU-14]APE13609.1 ABC transporter ATP-binding protein [Spiroplasma sp. NBRC 100390]
MGKIKELIDINKIEKNLEYNELDHKNQTRKQQTPLEMMKEIKAPRIGFFKLVAIYYRRYLLRSFTILFTLVLSSTSIVTITLLINKLMTQILFEFGNDPGAVTTGLDWWIWLIIIGVVLVIGVVTTNIRERVGGMLGRNIEIDVRNAVLNNLVNLNIGYYSDKKIGETMTKLINDTQIIGDESQLTPANLISIPIIFIGSAIVLLNIDWKLALICLGATSLFMTAVAVTFRSQASETENVRAKITDVNGDVTDRIASIALIKATGTEEYERVRFEQIHKEYYRINRRLNRIQARMTTIIILCALSLTVIVVLSSIILYGNKGTESTNHIMKVLPAFITGVNTLAFPIWTLTGLVPGLARATASTKRIIQLIRVDTTIDPNRDASNVNEITGDIVLKDIIFEYPEKPGVIILPKTTVKFEKGKSYAFVGETGSGKSTISKLLLRFYDPTSGEVIVNNTNLKDLNLASYLTHVGYVEQEPKILFGDVIYNVRYGMFNATEEEVIEACKKANLHDLVMGWKDGYNTILGERGFMLSGGQKQRLVIARMILKNPQILILDEATSALDNIVEKEIQAELEKIMVGKTTISIAHRLSTIKNVDKIFVLGKGQGIIQSGKYDELITIDGPFRELHRAGNQGR